MFSEGAIMAVEGKKPNKKGTFHIPSADDIAKFEREIPKFQSHFQSRKQPPTSGGCNEGKKTTSFQANLKKTTLITTGQSTSRNTPANKNSVRTVEVSTLSSVQETSTSQQEATHNNGSNERSSVSDLQRKRGKPVSSFAAKFGSLKDDDEEDKGTSLGDVKRTKPDGESVTVPAVSKPSSGPVSNTKNTSNSILVNPRQRGNPILKSVRNIPWEFGDIVPDYVMGRTVCALFLSLRYHHLNPNYIHGRLKELGSNYELRILLVQVDVKDPHYSLKELARMAILAECTLILAWSPEEAGRYLETYKSYENKPVDALKEKVEQDFVAQVTDCLTTVKSVNKTDVITLLSTFGSVQKIMSTSKDDFCLIPGFGPQKAQRLYDAFQEPFLKQS